MIEIYFFLLMLVLIFVRKNGKYKEYNILDFVLMAYVKVLACAILGEFYSLKSGRYEFERH